MFHPLLLPVVWILGMTLALGYLGSIALMLRRLEVVSPERFQALGSPKLPGRLSGATAWRVWRFFMTRQYEAIEDEKLTRLGTRARFAFLIAAPTVTLFMALNFAAMLAT